MNKRLEIVLFGVVFFLLSIYLATRLVSEGGRAIEAIVVLALFGMVLVNAVQAWWVGLTLGLLWFPYNIPVFLLDRLSSIQVWGTAMFVLVLAQSAIQRGGRRVTTTVGARLIVATGAIVLLRAVYDRPGSSRILGMMGGGAQMLMYALAVPAFWAMSVIAAGHWDPRRNLRALAASAACTGVLVVLRALTESESERRFVGTVASFLFLPAMWTLFALALAWLFHQKKAGKAGRMFPVYLVGLTGFMLLAAALSPHRSRPLFAITIILGVAVAYGFGRRAMVLSIVAGGLLIGGIATVHSGGLPSAMRRSLSTLFRVAPEEARWISREFGMSSEFGWTSEFRTTMNALAWDKIRRSPFVGAGFAFQREEIIQALQMSGGHVSGEMLGLAVAGGYHNSVLALTVACGVPAGILFSAGYLILLVQFVRAVRHMVDPGLKVFGAALLGAFGPISGQMLMNGAGLQFYIVCVVLGLMNGILHRLQREHSPSAVDSANKQAADRSGARAVLPRGVPLG